MQLGGTIIPVSCNQANNNSFVNALNGQAPVIAQAGTVLFPCALFLGTSTNPDNLVTDLANLVTANMVIRQGSETGTVLFEQVIQASAFNAALTYAQWAATSAWHFAFSMSTTDTNLAEGTVWIGIGVTAAGGVDIPVTFCSNASIKSYGIFNAAAPTAPDYTSWSKKESDARYAGSPFVSLLALYNAGFFVLNPVAPDFRYPRNAMYAAVVSF